MSDKIVFEKQVVIAASQSVVFDFVAEPTNDPRWRAEAERMEHPTPFTIGDTVTEYATFQGAQLVTPTVLRAYDRPHQTRLETAEDFAHYLESLRTVESIDATTSRFTYRLTLDPEILRPVMPELPPVDALLAWYGKTVEGYLATLKTILEKGDR